MVLPSLHEQLASAGLGRLEAVVSGLSETAIGFWLTAPVGRESEGPPSKLGGHPDVPGRFQWPVHGDHPLDFLLQLNLSDLRGMEMARLLPRSGLLSFFYDRRTSPWGLQESERTAFRVLYFEPKTTLVRTPSPSGAPGWGERSLDFFPRISIPHLRSRSGDLLELRAQMTPWELERYGKFASEYERRQGPPLSDCNHHFLGYSENIQNDMQTQAHRVTRGIAPGAQDLRRSELETGADDWVLLLQLDSDPSADLLWGDSGMLYFWIPRQDLRDRRFEHTWAIVQCP